MQKEFNEDSNYQSGFRKDKEDATDLTCQYFDFVKIRNRN